MKKLSNKTRMNIAVVLFLSSIVFLITTIVIHNYIKEIWIVATGIALCVICFIISVIVTPLEKENTIQIKNNINILQSNKKHHNPKKKLLSEKEWKELEEEDDEMMFIDEIVEDD